MIECVYYLFKFGYFGIESPDGLLVFGLDQPDLDELVLETLDHLLLLLDDFRLEADLFFSAAFGLLGVHSLVHDLAQFADALACALKLGRGVDVMLQGNPRMLCYHQGK